jgi:hypothetical protein
VGRLSRSFGLIGLTLLLLVVGCDDDGAEATPTGTPTPTATSTAVPTPTPVVESCAVDMPRGVQVSEPFVCIDYPTPTATILEAVAVAGYAAGAFENNIAIDVLESSGSVIASSHATSVAPDLGMVGPWSVVLPLPAQPMGSTGTIHAYAESPRDGSIAFEDTVEIRFGG